MAEKCVSRYVTVTCGMRGYFATLIGLFSDGNSSYYEPIQTSDLSFDNKDEAMEDAINWAKSEGIKVDNG